MPVSAIYYHPNPPTSYIGTSSPGSPGQPLPPGLHSFSPTASFFLIHRLFRTPPTAHLQKTLQLLEAHHILPLPKQSIALVTSPSTSPSTTETRAITVSTPDFVNILKTKMNALWTYKQGSMLKVEGQVWEMGGGEWRVRVGRVKMEGGSLMKGMLVEVEWAGQGMVGEVVREFGEKVLGLKGSDGGRWYMGVEGEEGGVEQQGKVWGKALLFKP